MQPRPRRSPVLLALGFALAVATPASAQTHFSGSIGPGSTYEIDVPATWNGDLVLYAHGIVQADRPVAPPTIQDGHNQLRAALLSAGYAVAASSFSSNGWSLDDAVRRTHQLSGIFKSKVGQARRTFLVGHSMGALAIVKMAETWPGQYDGALPMCGPLGGALAELQYAGDARVTFDFYFPGVLPGTPFDVPSGTPYLPPNEPGGPSPLFLRVYTALSANPTATFQWATAAHLPFADATELGNAALYVVGFVWRYTNDFIERVNGKIPYDNMTTQYQVNVTADPATNAYLSALLNAGVQRFSADRAAINYYQRNYAPTGRIGIPVLTLHTTRDPGIPFTHEGLFFRDGRRRGQSRRPAGPAVGRSVGTLRVHGGRGAERVHRPRTVGRDRAETVGLGRAQGSVRFLRRLQRDRSDVRAVEPGRAAGCPPRVWRACRLAPSRSRSSAVSDASLASRSCSTRRREPARTRRPAGVSCTCVRRRSASSTTRSTQPRRTSISTDFDIVGRLTAL